MEQGHLYRSQSSFFKELFNDKKYIFEIVGFLGIVAGLSLQINKDSGLIGWKGLQAVSLLLFIVSIYWLVNEFAQIASNELERHKKNEGFWKDEISLLQILLQIPLNLFLTYIFLGFYMSNYEAEFIKIFRVAFFPLLILFTLLAEKMLKSTIRDHQPLILFIIDAVIFFIFYFSLTWGFALPSIVSIISSVIAVTLFTLLSWLGAKTVWGVLSSVAIFVICIILNRSSTAATNSIRADLNEWSNTSACLQIKK